MTTPPTEGSSDGWAVPERDPAAGGGAAPGATGWGAAAGWGQPPQATPGGEAAGPPGQPPRPGQPVGQGWGQLTGPGQQPYGSVLTRRGIIALKPLGFGDFFDGSFRAIRHNPKVMIGLSALVLAVTNLLVALPLVGLFAAGGLFDPTATGDELSDEQLAGALGSLVALVPTAFLQTIAIIVLTGILILSVTQSVVDRRLGAKELWQRARGRVLPLVGWSFLQSVGGSLLVAAALTPGLVLLVLEEFVGGAVALVVLGLAVAVLAAWLYVKLVFVPVLIVVERLGIVASWKRSFALTRGAFWKTLGILLLTGVLTSIVSQLLATPFSIVGGLGLVLLESNPALAGAIYAGAISLGTTVGLVLAVPFLAAVVSLLYVDRRIRLEGLDVTLARTLEDGQA